MRRKTLLTAIALLSIIAFTTQVKAQSSAKLNQRDARISAAVRAVLDGQVAAWNRGDIENFMNGYARSADTVFVSGESVTHGWQTVLDRYKKNYDSPEKMGTLTFSDLEITPMGNDVAVVLGSWRLKRVNDEPHGRFTLIFRKKKWWKIVHDHTSSA